MATLITEIEQQVRARLKELEPLLEEAEQLRRVLENFEQSRGAPTQAPRTQAARPAARRASKGPRRRGRPAGSSSGNRAAEAMRLVDARPGITVSELADEMGIGRTYLYRVMPKLEKDGKVRKSGQGYELAASASAKS
jgi:biotin operon repressor